MSKRVLYLGTDPARYETDGEVVHYPIIAIKSRGVSSEIIEGLKSYTHLIFTSRNAVALFFEAVKKQQLYSDIKIIAIGKATEALISVKNPIHTAEKATQEGVIALLEGMELKSARILLPQSSLARPLLRDYLKRRGVDFTAFTLYDTVTEKKGELPELSEFDELVFTSPSTVQAFFALFGTLPEGKHVRCIGEVTRESLVKKLT